MSGLLLQDFNQMQSVTTGARIDRCATGTYLVPQQAILFSDHVALVV
jgi:hypothetical protein